MRAISARALLLALLTCVEVQRSSEIQNPISFSTDTVSIMDHGALNDCIRRIFTFNRWESVQYLRLSFGYPSLVEIFESRSRKFLKQLSLLGNSTLEYLQKLHEQ